MCKDSISTSLFAIFRVIYRPKVNFVSQVLGNIARKAFNMTQSNPAALYLAGLKGKKVEAYGCEHHILSQV